MGKGIDLGMTESAQAHLAKVISVKDGALGIRIGVKKAGCSGYEYTLEFAYDLRPNEFCFEKDSFSLFVDQTIYWKFLKGGTVVDYEQKGVQSAITFHNPNVAAQCGCGESFTLVDES
jgi:iron-sulfur cluster assembly accessory protein